MIEINVVEHVDERGTYCNVWETGSKDGQTYDDLEAAGWDITRRYWGQEIDVTVYGDDNELARFNRARHESARYFLRQERITAAPRDKRTGRPLFVSY